MSKKNYGSPNTSRMSLTVPNEDYKKLRELAFKRGFRSVPALCRNWVLCRLEHEKQKGKFVQDEKD